MYLNEELTSAKDEIKRIRSRNSALETNVVEKEEITVFLVKKLNEITLNLICPAKRNKIIARQVCPFFKLLFKLHSLL